MRFVGVGREHLVVCATCAVIEELAAIEVIAACDACHARAGAGGWVGIVGRPAIAARATAARFTHLDVPIATAFVDVQPLRGPPGDDRARWIGLAADGGLHRWDADRGTLDLR
ncbi:MAG: hypothetical protein NT062_01410, partial [Proteobacteria bacterium]|nr:hypothetical protein [Pseudomonadota bacterium]